MTGITLTSSQTIKGIPGYSGHGPKIYAENIYGTTFKESRIKAKMIKLDQLNHDKEKLEEVLLAKSANLN